MLRRDSLWLAWGAPQLEFVVDNETLAGMANLEMAVSNPIHEFQIRRIQVGLKSAFADTLAQKLAI